MYQYKGQTDTIAAIATPPGPGGIGIVRLSGEKSLSILEHIFLARAQEGISSWKSHSARLGWIVRDLGKKDILDEVLVMLMRSPKSYTTEDVVEIHCHAGAAVVRSVLELCLKQGARLAEPGEFTKRAFLNGRIDLAQAEAVADIIHAKTEAFLRASTHQLKGDLSTELEAIREGLLTALAGLEAIINFPDDAAASGHEESLLKMLSQMLRRVEALVLSAQSGRILKEGLRVVICGKPNVGKSSLLNAFLKEQRAIVTDVAGTTRDVLEETANIRGIPLTLVDTAGILTPRDKVEEEAVRRSRASIAGADIVLLVLDFSTPLESIDTELFKGIKNPHLIVVVNKTDLPRGLDVAKVSGHFSSAEVVKISVMTKDGLEVLKDKMLELAVGKTGMDVQLGHAIVVSNIRHVEALQSAREAIGHATTSLQEDLSFEFVSEDIKSAVNCLDAITGRNVDADMIDQIFEKFCIGK
ncbi:MAG: tRNA uridine-5-carboxymethylaminomethyl(34) synthesis GTPase MnmE [Candidatus Omnitrophica bacterium]|nr:tRNA uridine-5-carboxymethylaminomethyl(34) synthesis GTPase MnmE [Candidatus Omnitrophota bacterium]